MDSDNGEVIKGIENPSLVDAIKEYYKNNSDQNADALDTGLMKATYLAAMMEDNLQIDNGIAQVGSTFSLGTIQDDDGKMLLPIFTDWIHLNESVPGKDGYVLSAEQAFTMGIEQFDGVVINHTHLALPIYKESLSYLLSKKNA